MYETMVVTLLVLIVWLLVLKNVSAEAILLMTVISGACLLFLGMAILMSWGDPSIVDIIHLANTNPYALEEYTIWELLNAFAPLYSGLGALSICSYAYSKYSNRNYPIVRGQK